jgi:hypothetical protein
MRSLLILWLFSYFLHDKKGILHPVEAAGEARRPGVVTPVAERTTRGNDIPRGRYAREGGEVCPSSLNPDGEGYRRTTGSRGGQLIMGRRAGGNIASPRPSLLHIYHTPTPPISLLRHHASGRRIHPSSRSCAGSNDRHRRQCRPSEPCLFPPPGRPYSGT